MQSPFSSSSSPPSPCFSSPPSPPFLPRKWVVLYGSQSGTSQDLSDTIHRDLIRYFRRKGILLGSQQGRYRHRDRDTAVMAKNNKYNRNTGKDLTYQGKILEEQIDTDSVKTGKEEEEQKIDTIEKLDKGDMVEIEVEVCISSMDDYLSNFEKLHEETMTAFIFIVSTTGEGEVCDNMEKSWKFLLKKTLSKEGFVGQNMNMSNSMQNQNQNPKTKLSENGNGNANAAIANLPLNCWKFGFTIFGCGDSSYEKYNIVARKLYARLKQLGANILQCESKAKAIAKAKAKVDIEMDETGNGGNNLTRTTFIDVDMGLGDEQSRLGVVGDFDIWSKTLWDYIDSQYWGIGVTEEGKKLTYEEMRNESKLDAPLYSISSISWTGKQKQKQNFEYRVAEGTLKKEDTEDEDEKESEKEKDGKSGNYYRPLEDFNCRYKPPNAYRYYSVPVNEENENKKEKEQKEEREKEKEQEQKQEKQKEKEYEREQARKNRPEIRGRCVYNRRVTATNWQQETFHIGIDISPSLPFPSSSSSSSFSTTPTLTDSITECHDEFMTPISICQNIVENRLYKAGDVAHIYPCNTRQEVHAFLSLLGYDPKEMILIQSLSSSYQGNNSISTKTKTETETKTRNDVEVIEVDMERESEREREMEGEEGDENNEKSDISETHLSSFDHFPFPMKPISLEDLFCQYIDINSLPKRHFFYTISYFTDNEEEKEKLLEIASIERIDFYYEYVVREKKTYMEVLSEFRSFHHNKSLPLERLLEIMPQIKPRPYSIASSPISFIIVDDKKKDNHNHNSFLPLTSTSSACTSSICSSSTFTSSSIKSNFIVELCVAVVTTVTPLKRTRYGLCSNFLKNLQIGDCVYLDLSPGSFNLPSPFSFASSLSSLSSLALPSQSSLSFLNAKEQQKQQQELEQEEVEREKEKRKRIQLCWKKYRESFIPLILIGPGTGVAPMKAIIEERYAVHSYLMSTVFQNYVSTYATHSAPKSKGKFEISRGQISESELDTSFEKKEEREKESEQYPLKDYLFFGCRKKGKDFYFQDLFCSLSEKKQLFFSVAFSRAQTRKEYVTHKLQANAPLIRWLLLEKDASIYVAGSANGMPKNVYEMIKKILFKKDRKDEEEKNLMNEEAKKYDNDDLYLEDETEAIQFLAYLQKKKKYSVEAWSN